MTMLIRLTLKIQQKGISPMSKLAYFDDIDDGKEKNGEEAAPGKGLTEEDFERIKEEDAAWQEEKERSGFVKKVIEALLIAVCVYVVFLTYGVFNTNYAYNDQGVIEPQVLTAQEIREKREFEVILYQYERCRILYEEVLMLDYRLAQGIEDPLLLSTEYADLISKEGGINVVDLAAKTQSLTVSSKYAQLKDSLYYWIAEDMNGYLVNITSGITDNNADAAQAALEYKDALYDDFSTLTNNIITIGQSLNGVDMTEYIKWSPEGYVYDQVNQQ